MRRIEPLLFALCLLSALLACKRKPPTDEAATATPELPVPPPAPPPAPPELPRPTEPAAPTPPPAAPPRAPSTAAPKTTTTAKPGTSAKPTTTAPASAPTGTAPAPTATTPPKPAMTRQECLGHCDQVEAQGKALCAPVVGSPAGDACLKNAAAVSAGCRDQCPKQ